jgi:hypothetical protein
MEISNGIHYQGIKGPHTTMLGKQEVAVIAPSWIGDSIENFHYGKHMCRTPILTVHC